MTADRFDLRTGVAALAGAVVVREGLVRGAAGWGAPMAVLAIVYPLTLLLLLVAAARARPARLGLRRARPGAIVAGCLVGGAAVVVLGGLNASVARLGDGPPPGHLEREELATWLSVALSVGLAPLVEEIAFRGVLMRALATAWSPAAAIGVSAVAFAVVHASPYQVVIPLGLGVAAGYLAWRTDSIVPGLLLHACNNLHAAVRRASETVWRYEQTHGPGLTLVAVAAVLVAVVLARRAQPAPTVAAHATPTTAPPDRPTAPHDGA